VRIPHSCIFNLCKLTDVTARTAMLISVILLYAGRLYVCKLGHFSAILITLTHLFMVTMLGLFIAHVQITTRLICSSCPLIYIGLASILKAKNDANIQKNNKRNQYLVIIYLVLFNFLGILLHPNFYPWT
jgi:hypothetical protein